MNPDIPPQDQTAQQLRALPSLPPKRRCKISPASPEDIESGSVIIPFYNPSQKPVRFHRSSQPLQVWKEAEPHWQEPSAPKSEALTSLGESLQAFARVVTGPWRVHHSP